MRASPDNILSGSRRRSESLNLTATWISDWSFLILTLSAWPWDQHSSILSYLKHKSTQSQHTFNDSYSFHTIGQTSPPPQQQQFNLNKQSHLLCGLNLVGYREGARDLGVCQVCLWRDEHEQLYLPSALHRSDALL